MYEHTHTPTHASVHRSSSFVILARIRASPTRARPAPSTPPRAVHSRPALDPAHAHAHARTRWSITHPARPHRASTTPPPAPASQRAPQSWEYSAPHRARDASHHHPHARAWRCTIHAHARTRTHTTHVPVRVRSSSPIARFRRRVAQTS